MTPSGSALAVALAASLGAPGAALGTDVLKVEPRSLDEYGESFTFLADLEDGSYLQLQLAVTNIGPGNGHGLCSLLVKRPRAAAFTVSDRVSRDGWSYASHPEERLAVGVCEAVATTAQTRVRMAKNGLSVSLTYPGAPFHEPLPPGNVDTGGRTLRNWVLYWTARVQATLTAEGKTSTLSGGGYADHSRTTCAPSDLARTWVRFRGVRNGASTVLVGRLPRLGRAPPVWLRPDHQPPVEFAAMAIHRAGPRDRPEWKVDLSGGEGGALSTSQLIYRFDPLAELGTIGALVTPFVSAPVTYSYRGTLKLGQGPGVEGIMEVEVFED